MKISYLASKAKAIIPAAKGAEAEVPVCLMVHLFPTSVVAFEKGAPRLIQILTVVILESARLTYNHLIRVSPAGIGCCHRGRTFFTVPRELSMLRSTSDR